MSKGSDLIKSAVDKAIASGGEIIIEKRAPQTHVVPVASLRNNYGRGVLSAEDVILVVRDQRGVGFGLGFVPEGVEARQETGGPMVPGPWAYSYGLPAVLSADGHGSAWEREEARKAGLLIEAVEGDLLDVDGTLYRIMWKSTTSGVSNYWRRGEYLDLVLVQA
jgi:hypothetical protein